MTYRELKAKLDELDEAQLGQKVRSVGEDRTAEIDNLWILPEDYVNPEGDCSMPVSEVELDDIYTADDLADEPRIALKGDVFLSEVC